MEETTTFHSKLSSIMEKVLVSAVAEIKQLVCDYCAEIHVELSREKQHNSIMKEELKLYRPVNGFTQASQDGEDGACTQQRADQMESSAKKRSKEESAEKTGTSRFTDHQFEPVPVKCEAASEEHPQLKAPSRVSDSPLQQDVQSSQVCREPPALHVDHKQCVELSASPSRDEFLDVGFHIKEESERSDLQTPREDFNLGFEVQQGILFQMYTDTEALLDIPAETCFSGLEASDNHPILETLDVPDVSINGHVADGDASNQQGSVLESRSGSCDVSAFRTNRGTGRLKYTCDYCGKGFPFLSTMKGHRLSHTGERTQVCGQCGMSFVRRSHLTRHELLHLGVRPFTCQVCGRKFSRRAHLNAHMKVHCR